MPTLAWVLAFGLAASLTLPAAAGGVAIPGGLDARAAANPPALSAATPVASPTARPASIRNLRYCEVLPTYRDGDILRTEVWNTMGLNDCPEDAWAALDADALQAELGAVRVLLNGPRFWLMDRIVPLGGTTASGKRATFGGIPMELRATLETPVSAAQPGSQPYTETTVLRNTRYVFAAGEPVFTLTAPDGRVYVMQTYARIVDPALDVADLPDLGSRLHLPDGWRYQPVLLDADLVLEVDGKATVVQDDLLNTYQLATVAVPGLDS